jgi:hypothetical protein
VSIVLRVILFRIFMGFLFKNSFTTVAAKVIGFIFVVMYYCKLLVHFNTANRVNRHQFEHLHVSIYIYPSAIIFNFFIKSKCENILEFFRPFFIYIVINVSGCSIITYTEISRINLWGYLLTQLSHINDLE